MTSVFEALGIGLTGLLLGVSVFAMTRKLWSRPS